MLNEAATRKKPSTQKIKDNPPSTQLRIRQQRNYLINKAQQKRYESLYQQHVNALKRQGKSKATIEAYSRAVRRITSLF